MKTLTDHRRHPREMTIESLDRDIRLMGEMLEMLSKRKYKPNHEECIKEWNDRQEIDRLRARIPELIKMKEEL